MRFLLGLLILAFSPVLAAGQDAVYPVAPTRVYQKALTGGNYMFNYYLPPAGTGTPWWPAWSPDDQSLAFSLQGIYLEDGYN